MISFVLTFFNAHFSSHSDTDFHQTFALLNFVENQVNALVHARVHTLMGCLIVASVSEMFAFGVCVRTG